MSEPGDTFHTEVDGDIIAEVAREYGMGAGGLKGLLSSLHMEDMDTRQEEAVREALNRQAERNDMEPMF